MSDYEPLDLSTWCNAGLGLLPGQPPSGAVTQRGLPFQIGPADAAIDAPRLIHFPKDAGSLTLPIDRHATRVLVAHVLLESHLLEGGPLAVKVADYRFRLAQGRVDVPIRERFEINIAQPPWGQLPFASHYDVGEGKPDRQTGHWGQTGFRQTEASGGAVEHWCFYVFTPPQAGVVESLTIVPAGPAFAIAAITLSTLEEEPFPTEAAVPVIVETTDGASRRGHLDLVVDRGTATYAQSLPAGEPMAGWGSEQNPEAAPAVSDVSAVPSARLTVRHGQDELGQVPWSQVRETGAAEGGVVRVRLAEEGRNWVHTRVVDAESGAQLPCRVHFMSPAGVPYAPHGHHPYANGNLGSWHLDIGGDLRLGHTTYAYIDGTCQGWLPRGPVVVDVARGYEYEPLRTTVEIIPGQRELTLQLKRVRDLNAEGWYSGDTHVHFLSTVGAHTEAAGEGLNVVNLLQSQWGHLFTNTEEFLGEPVVRGGNRTIVYASQENRQHVLGHLSLLGLKQPVMPWCSDGPSEAELGGNLETTLSRWADACRAQGGTVVTPHMPNPNGEIAALIATGRVDAMEFVTHDSYSHLEWYRYLNGGYKLPLVGGTDKMTQDVPVGLYRTYVHIPADEEFTYDAWCRHLRAGHTMLSGGPLVFMTVDGHQPGDELRLTTAGTVTVEAEVSSIFGVHTLQIVLNGQVVAQSESSEGSHHLRLREEVRVDGHSWLAARVAGPGYGTVPHHDCWRRGIMAHTSPVYLAVGGPWQRYDPGTTQYMLTLIEGSLAHIRGAARHYPHDHERVTHHHGHEDHRAWLEEPFAEARAVLHRRMHEMGVAH